MVTAARPPRTIRTYQPKKETSLAELWNTSFPIDAMWGIYARQSTAAQLIKHPESTEMQTDDLRQWLLEKRVRRENISLFDADLGKSGTLRIDQRTGLQELVSLIQADIIKAVLVYRVSRLFRDETGVQYNTFAQICKEHNCILATADGMFFNFNNPMHLKMFRYLAEQAAEYLPQQMKLLFEARVRKARRGYYVGFGMKPWGLIVDYNPLSPTYQKYIVYEPHAAVVFETLERFYALEADFNELCRELEKRPVLFPEFEDWVDPRNIPAKKRKVVPGGYHITQFGLRLMLTNPIYIGWLVVLGDIISRNNDFRIVPEDKEYLFWNAFNNLADYTTDGKENDQRQRQPRRFYQKHTQIQALLNKKKLFSPHGKVSIHPSRYGSTYTITPTDHKVKQHQFCEIDTKTIDREIGKIFVARLMETHDLDEYQHWLTEEANKVDNKTALIHTQLAEIAKAQQAILSERIDMQKEINDIQDEEKRQIAKREAAGEFERLRKRSIQYDNLAAELKAQLPTSEENEETNELRKARKFLSFQDEAQKLIHVWEHIPVNVRAEFFNLFLVQAVFTVVAPHWIQLDIYWRHPAWEQDKMYIYRKHGIQPLWTDEEREILRAYYPSTPREALLQLLPTKTWKSIRTEASNLRVQRPIKFREEEIPMTLTWTDLAFMRQQGITDRSTKYESSSRS